MRNKDLVKKLAIALSALIGGIGALNSVSVSAMEAADSKEQAKARLYKIIGTVNSNGFKNYHSESPEEIYQSMSEISEMFKKGILNKNDLSDTDKNDIKKAYIRLFKWFIMNAPSSKAIRCAIERLQRMFNYVFMSQEIEILENNKRLKYGSHYPFVWPEEWQKLETDLWSFVSYFEQCFRRILFRYELDGMVEIKTVDSILALSKSLIK